LVRQTFSNSAAAAAAASGGGACPLRERSALEFSLWPAAKWTFAKDGRVSTYSWEHGNCTPRWICAPKERPLAASCLLQINVPRCDVATFVDGLED